MIIAIAAACGSRSAPKVDKASCVPGESQSCVCEPGVEGVQVCTDASVYESCRCGSSTDLDMGMDAGDATPTPGDMGDREDVGQPPDMSNCTPETDDALCGTRCGSTAAVDRCGQMRELECGGCAGGEQCVQNACCAPETDAQLCSAEAAVCGSVSAVDRCGNARAVTCGICTNGFPCIDNQCTCETDTNFFGQIGGVGAHDGGVPTTGSLSNDAGLDDIAASMPLVDGLFVPVSIAVTGATVVATTFDSRANETFWLQDGVTTASVRLAFASIFVDVRVGDRVSFTATELQNFEGHPQISALSNFTILSRDNVVPYRDRTGQAITIGDYGRVVRVGGVLGSPTLCGGTSSCYPLTHGARTVTLRSASVFYNVGDCVTFIGPVYSFPGPLGIGAEPQLDEINFSWSQTAF